MNRIERGIQAAREAAELSTHTKFRLGAAIYLGNRLVSIGWNNYKTSPNVSSIFNWHHAETNALIGTDKHDLSRADIYVVRLKRSGSMGTSRPCRMCRNVLAAAGVRRAIYLDKNGGVAKEYL